MMATQDVTTALGGPSEPTQESHKLDSPKRQVRQENPERYKEHDKNYYTRNRKEILARRRERYRLKEQRDRKIEPLPTVPLEPELEKAITAFVNVKAMRGEKTYKWYADNLRLFAEFLVMNDLPEWPLDPDCINAWLADLKLRGARPHTLFSYWRCLKTFVLFLIRRGQAGPDTMDLVEKPIEPKPIPKVVKVEDMKKLLATLERASRSGDPRAVRDYALIMLALDSGARVGELAKLKFENLDLHQRVFWARETKTATTRTIVFSDETASALSGWLVVREGIDTQDEEHVFLGLNLKTRLTTDGMRNALRYWQDQAEIERFNFHRIRATYAVYSIRARADVLDVQKQMGHTNLATTQRYVMVDDEGRAERHNQRNPLDYLMSWATS